MTSMLDTIIPKSDQLNADDLMAGRTMTITIAKVAIKMDEQPVAIHFDGDGGKPYKPGKSMRRVLVNVWGPDANAYVGRSLTLYRDDSVKFGGQDVGGIRISHMSHITKSVTMALTATKAQRRPFTVQPLVTKAAEPAASSGPRRKVSDILTDIEQEFADAIPQGRAAVEAVMGADDVVKALDKFQNGALEKLQGIIKDALDRTAEVGNDPTNATDDDDTFPGDRPSQAA